MSPSEFNTGDPIAYFLTWTTYGTWLPGDDRGWNRKGEFESLPSDPLTNESAKATLKESPFLTSASDRLIVENTIHKHCQIRSWELHAINVRTNHVHVVTTAPKFQPKTVVSQFKAWCTRNLKPNHPDRERFWTQRASYRWLNKESELSSAIDYVLEAQDRKGSEYDR